MRRGTALDRQRRGTGAGAGEAAARRGPERAEPPRPLHGGRGRSPGGAGGAQLLLLQPGLHVSGAEGDGGRRGGGGSPERGRSPQAGPGLTGSAAVGGSQGLAGRRARPVPPGQAADSRRATSSGTRAVSGDLPAAFG